MNLITLSQQLLMGVRTNAPIGEIVAQLATMDEFFLERELTGDDQKKAFWINVYNAFTQLALMKNPGAYAKKNHFFSDKNIMLAGIEISLDDIEHGILRRSKIKWAFGYLNKWFPSAFERKHRVHKLDYRVHFALNCGAASCPPIAFYDPVKISSQLDLATGSFLSDQVEFNAAENLVRLPMVMHWYRFDFGGNKNIVALLRKFGLIPDARHPSLRYKEYNWQLLLENYKNPDNE